MKVQDKIIQISLSLSFLPPSAPGDPGRGLFLSVPQGGGGDGHLAGEPCGGGGATEDPPQVLRWAVLTQTQTQ